MSAQHTPGPWSWNGAALWGAELDATHNGKTCMECGHCPSECGPSVLGVAGAGLEDEDEAWVPTDADKQLIAAAPDLLRVAELLVDWLNEEPGAHKLSDTARAAIAKATGIAS